MRAAFDWQREQAPDLVALGRVTFLFERGEAGFAGDARFFSDIGSAATSLDRPAAFLLLMISASLATCKQASPNRTTRARLRSASKERMPSIMVRKSSCNPSASRLMR